MKNIFSIIMLVLSINCSSQEFKYKTIPKEIQQHDYFIEFNSLDISKFVDATDFLPSGYVKDGSIDYTAYLQVALNKNRHIKMPNFPVLINDKSLEVKSNSKIFFQSNSSLIMKASNSGDHYNKPYYAIKLFNVSNVVIYNAHIIGDRKTHIGEKGEWGMGIGILGSSNIHIVGGKITNCWGDGIYIGKIKQRSDVYEGFHIPSTGIKIANMIIDNNRRNGISITSAIDVKIENSIISNTNGTLPMSGIDIEPNAAQDLMRNIRINNVTTFNNQKDGLLLVLTRLPSNKFAQEVGIEIDNHTDIGSYSPLRIGSGFRKNDKMMKGKVSISNAIWKDNSVGIRYNRGSRLIPNIEFRNVRFEGTKSEKVLNDKYMNTIKHIEVNTL